jgi:hypothetical protein
MQPSAFGHNSWHTFARGRFVEDGTQSRVEVRLGLSRSIGIFYLVVFGFAILVGLALLTAIRQSGTGIGSSLGMLAPVIGMCGFFVILHIVGVHFAQGEGERLLQFLCETLDAQEVPAQVHRQASMKANPFK